jgi:UDP-N-acetylglucosamine transferase subunit ALG13
VTHLVLALAGTDHHPFDRLVRWVDDAATRHGDVRFVVQHGTSAPPRVAEGHAFLGHDLMLDLMQQATLVVCHGGPGTIMDAREAGHVPLCVPRDPALGEHVDGHQQRFAAIVGQVGIIRLVPTVEALCAEVDQARRDGPLQRVSAALSTAREQARALVAEELDSLISVPRPRTPRRRWAAAPSGR